MFDHWVGQNRNMAQSAPPPPPPQYNWGVIYSNMFRVKISNEAAPAAIHYLPGFVGHPVHLVHVDAEGVLHCVNHHVHLSKKILSDKTALCLFLNVSSRWFCTAIFRVLRQNFAVRKVGELSHLQFVLWQSETTASVFMLRPKYLRKYTFLLV